MERSLRQNRYLALLAMVIMGFNAQAKDCNEIAHNLTDQPLLEDVVSCYNQLTEQGNTDTSYYEYLDAMRLISAKQYDEGLKKLEQSANNGFAWAMYELAAAYDKGLIVEKDEAKAFEWYEKAADANVAWTQYQLAILYFYGKNVKKSLEYLFQAAENNLSIAQVDIGAAFQVGDIEGIEQDYNKALEWYLKAAQNNYPPAQNDIGLMYFNGNGVEQDYNKALGWYLKAAQNGNIEGKYNLASLYYEGLGVKKNKKEAKRWFIKAAENGNMDALRFLATGFEPMRKKERQQWQLQLYAAEQGNTDLGADILKDAFKKK